MRTHFLPSEICLSTDCHNMKKVISKTFGQEQIQLLCIFHHLQCWFRWLWDSKHGIDNVDRQPIIYIIQSIVYISHESELQGRCNNFMKDSPERYVENDYCGQIIIFWKRRSEWALSCRVIALTHGNNTNNYGDASIRVLKEIIFLEE